MSPNRLVTPSTRTAGLVLEATDITGDHIQRSAVPESEVVTELHGERLVLRTPRPSDAAALRAIRAAPEVSAWWGPPVPAFPERDEPSEQHLTILERDQVVGFIQFAEEPDPDFRFAAMDMFVEPRHHRRGIASEALAMLIDHLSIEHGHHRFTIDPAVDNLPAIACYEKAGFTRVGVLRAAWRDKATGQWRDNLLMELIRF